MPGAEGRGAVGLPHDRGVGGGVLTPRPRRWNPPRLVYSEYRNSFQKQSRVGLKPFFSFAGAYGLEKFQIKRNKNVVVRTKCVLKFLIVGDYENITCLVQPECESQSDGVSLTRD